MRKTVPLCCEIRAAGFWMGEDFILLVEGTRCRSRTSVKVRGELGADVDVFLKGEGNLVFFRRRLPLVKALRRVLAWKLGGEVRHLRQAAAWRSIRMLNCSMVEEAGAGHG